MDKNIKNKILRFVILWLVNTIALVIVVHIIPGVKISNIETLFIAAIVLGFLNTFIRPLLIFFTLPFSIFSLGFFTLLINGFLFFIAAKIVAGFYVSGFWSAFWASIVFSICTFFLNHLLLPQKYIIVNSTKQPDSAKIIDRKVIDAEGWVVDEPEKKD
ncbi:MAG: phage holin family protein [Candidatus Omnitrophica bacterium]|jgi:putative membrane protein|nr:phage holin family protein [Candidatus Omnitrophota bacterium]